MFRTLIVMATVLGLTTSAVAQQSPFQIEGFVRGNDYRDYSPEFQTNYVVGAFDGLMTMVVALRLRTNVVPGFARLEACTKGWSATHLTDVVNRWLERHPETWTRYMGPLVVSALVEACNPSR